MSEFTGVVSSAGLAFDPHAGTQTVCPRILLGHACIKNEYECLCEQVETTEVYTTKNEKNGASVLTVDLNLIPNVGTAQRVMAGVELMGYKPNFQASKDVVSASFNLKRAENAALSLWVLDSGL